MPSLEMNRVNDASLILTRRRLLSAMSPRWQVILHGTPEILLANIAIVCRSQSPMTVDMINLMDPHVSR